MDRKAHWERVHETTAPGAASWFQPAPTIAAQLLERAGLRSDT